MGAAQCRYGSIWDGAKNWGLKISNGGDWFCKVGWLYTWAGFDRSYTMATHKQSIDLIMISTENPPASLIHIRITQTAQDIPNIWNSAEETPPKTKHVPF